MKPLRHALMLAALLAAEVVAASSIELPARVVPDPRRVQQLSATQASLLQGGSAGLPQPGRHVTAGTVLATLTPLLSQPERRDLGVERAAAQRDASIGELQLKRFNIEAAKQFDVQLPTPTALLVADYRTADGKRTALDAGLKGRSTLRASQDALLLKTRARQDAVVAEGTVLFELLQPGALAVEAVFTDEGLDLAQVREALTLDGTPLPVTLLAQSYDPALRSHRVLFALQPDAAVAVHQPLRLVVPRTRVNVQ